MAMHDDGEALGAKDATTASETLQSITVSSSNSKVGVYELSSMSCSSVSSGYTEIILCLDTNLKRAHELFDQLPLKNSTVERDLCAQFMFDEMSDRDVQKLFAGMAKTTFASFQTAFSLPFDVELEVIAAITAVGDYVTNLKICVPCVVMIFGGYGVLLKMNAYGVLLKVTANEAMFWEATMTPDYDTISEFVVSFDIGNVVFTKLKGSPPPPVTCTHPYSNMLVAPDSSLALHTGTALIGLSSSFIFVVAVSVTFEMFGPNSGGVNEWLEETDKDTTFDAYMVGSRKDIHRNQLAAVVRSQVIIKFLAQVSLGAAEIALVFGMASVFWLGFIFNDAVMIGGFSRKEEMKKVALERYKTMRGDAPERLVSGYSMISPCSFGNPSSTNTPKLA